MIPFALAAASKIAGPLIGAIGQTQAINQGMRNFRNNVTAGSDTLRAGQTAANKAFDPYATAGTAGAQGELGAVQNRQQAAMPTLTNTSPDQMASFMDPSMAYTQQQAMKQAQAAGIAGGALGGGFLKALSADASKRAQTSWNDQYQNLLNTNAQNFGQQQQNYQNTNDYQQQQIGNFGNIANRGLSAVGANQGLQAGYNQGINQNFNAIAGNEMAGWGTKGGIFDKAAGGFGDNLAGAITSIWGR
jgi:hypothetical protein